MFLKHTPHSGNKKGESLVEVIMAIFVVALGSGVATSLIVSALQANLFSRDNLVALNLAVEGIEAVREIRDANWLRFSYNKDQCWNMRPDATACGPVNIIAEGKYAVLLDAASYAWNISPTPITAGNLDLENSPDSVNSLYQLYYSDTTPSMYVTSITSNASPFYRMVTISYPSPEIMSVSVLVQWKSQGVTHQVSLQTTLTNYQKVKRTT